MHSVCLNASTVLNSRQKFYPAHIYIFGLGSFKTNQVQWTTIKLRNTITFYKILGIPHISILKMILNNEYM